MKSKNGLYIGIDPGSSTGGIAFIRTFIGYSYDVSAIKIKDMTERMLWEYFENIIKETTISAEKFCIIEKVHSMPGQGVSSTFKFGMNYGGLRMALIGNKIPFDECSPMKWQKYYGMKKKVIGTEKSLYIPKKPLIDAPLSSYSHEYIEKGKNIKESNTDWKRRLRQKAEQLFPQIKMTNNIADALLIAEYCRHLKY